MKWPFWVGVASAASSVAVPRGLGREPSVTWHESCVAARIDVVQSQEPQPPPRVEIPARALAVLVNVHTGEHVPLTADSPDEEAFSKLVEDRVTGSRVRMAPELLRFMRKLCQNVKDQTHAQEPIKVEIVSGYRSPKLNEMLRKHEHNVASHSQHSLGHALDFRIAGMSAKELRKRIESLGWKGGLGQYDKPTDNFVHIDVGPNRRWKER